MMKWPPKKGFLSSLIISLYQGIKHKLYWIISQMAADKGRDET